MTCSHKDSASLSIVYPVAERFISINGEGQKAGLVAGFIRMKGCNLACNYCDTAWANEDSCPCEYLTAGQLISWLNQEKIKYVTITGGEPLLVPGVDRLTECLGENGFLVEIETNGSIDITPLHLLRHRPSFTLDYKCPDSGMESHMLIKNYTLLNEKDTVKFVVSSSHDLDRAYQVSQEYHLAGHCRIYLSAVFGRIEASQIVDYMIRRHWNEACLQLQIHKYIWSPQQRGV